MNDVFSVTFSTFGMKKDSLLLFKGVQSQERPTDDSSRTLVFLKVRYPLLYFV